jgi:hypothetical protein
MDIATGNRARQEVRCRRQRAVPWWEAYIPQRSVFQPRKRCQLVSNGTIQAHILLAGWQENKALRFCDSEHKRLHFELWAPTDYGVKINSEHTRKLPVGAQLQEVLTLHVIEGSRVFCSCFSFLQDFQGHDCPLKEIAENTRDVHRVRTIVPSC